MTSIVNPEELYSSTGKPLYRPLFHEFEPTALLSLSNCPPKGKISLRDEYIKYCVEDPTEVTFAENVFGDVPWWFKTRETQEMKYRVDEWRDICSVIRKREAFKSLINEVKTNGRNSAAAAKYLIEEPWKDKRRFKKKIEETSEKAFTSKDIQADLERING